MVKNTRWNPSKFTTLSGKEHLLESEINDFGRELFFEGKRCHGLIKNRQVEHVRTLQRCSDGCIRGTRAGYAGDCTATRDKIQLFILKKLRIPITKSHDSKDRSFRAIMAVTNLRQGDVITVIDYF